MEARYVDASLPARPCVPTLSKYFPLAGVGVNGTAERSQQCDDEQSWDESMGHARRRCERGEGLSSTRHVAAYFHRVYVRLV
jgi:hypothetical protein